MDGLDADAAALEARLMAVLGDRALSWETPDDLGRRSIEQLAVASGRPLHSRGRVRLTGAGVTRHSADMDAVGAVMRSLQRLLSAAGAAMEGVTSNRGKLPGQILERTRVLLAASPAPGSVILNLEQPQDFQPEMNEPNQLSDRAAEAVVKLLATGNSDQGDPETSELLDVLLPLGPRAAGALRDLAVALQTAGFTTEVEWMEPNQPTRRAKISADEAGRIARVVRQRHLDTEEVTLTGTLRSKSDVSRIQVEVGERIVNIQLGQITRDMQRGLELGDRVRVVAVRRIARKRGGDPTVTYTGMSLQPFESAS